MRLPAYLALVVMLATGVPFALAIGRLRGLMLAAAGLLYGSGIVFLVMQTMSFLGIRWTLAPILGTCAIIAVASALIAARRKPPAHHPPPTRLTIIDLGSVALLACLARFTTPIPHRGGDFLFLWALKGRMFHDAGGIDWRFLSHPFGALWHPDYPLLVPLNHAFVALLDGGWNELPLHVLTVAWSAAIVLIVRAYAAEETSPWIASLIALATAGFSLAWYVGTAEPPMIAYSAAGLLLLRRAILFDDRVALAHAPLLLGFAASTKNEGLSLLVAVVAGLVVAARWRWLWRLWPAAAIAGPWIVISRQHALALDLTESGVTERIAAHLRDWTTMASLLWEYVHWPKLWLAIAIAFALGGLAALKRERFLLATLALQAAFFAGAYLVTPHKLRWHIANSAERLYRQLIVPVAVPTMLLLATIARTREDEEHHAEARPDHD